MNALKILIVENEILVSKELTSYLVHQKYQVSGAARTGEQALELVKEENPDIIIMDIDLDGELDGIQTATIIHETLIIPIIYLTDIKDEQTFNRASETLPATFLTKPFKNLDVRNAIEMAMRTLSSLLEKQAKDINISFELDLKGQKKDVNEFYTLDDRVFIKNEEGAYERIKLDEIVYIQAEGQWLTINSIYGERKIKLGLSRFLELVKDCPIFRIHKKTALNAKYVDILSKSEVKVEYRNGLNKLIQESFPIGSTYKDDVLNNFRVMIAEKATNHDLKPS